jgi:A/G-specific adenine glycosylase
VLEEGVPQGQSQPLRTIPLPSSAQLPAFRRRLLAWFHVRKRALPWRSTRDPYRIWLSEIMLQQTRVAAVLPYYRSFLAHFPNVRALARAPEDAVLEAWAGLGYYSRARNLHRAAQEIVRRHAGRFPRTPEAALALPGVGRYTAAAVLSIAYGAPLAVLDGNVARVLARLGAVRGDLRQPARWRQLEAAAERLLVPRSAASWNQAMMELGATVCTPRSPACPECPVARFCRARALGLQDELPAKRAKRSPETVRLAAAVLLDPHRRTLLVHPAKGDGLFSRMWQFPAVVAAREPEAALRRHLRDSLGIDVADCVALPAARHTVTYRRVTLLPFLVPVEDLPGPWPSGDARGESAHLALEEVERWPASSATRKIARAGLRSGKA